MRAVSLLDFLLPYRAAERALNLGEVQAGNFAGFTDPSTLPIVSPFSTGTDLHRIVLEDIFGNKIPVNSRAAAMRIPPVARARNRLVTAIQKLPMVDLAPGETAVTDPSKQPRWLSRTVDGSSPQHRLAWTADDLIFYGWSCWWKTPNQADRFPQNVGRISMGDWSVNADNEVEVNGIPQDPANVILIPGFHEGILTFGIDALADARELMELVRRRLKNPIAATELHQTKGPRLNKEDRRTLIDEYVAGRDRGDNVGYTPEEIELRTHGSDLESQLMIEARNASAVDLARMVGVSASIVDATAPKASLNYETTTGRNQEFVDHDLSLYMDPISARLSLDDVSPQGHRVAFDLTNYTGPVSPTGPALED